MSCSHNPRSAADETCNEQTHDELREFSGEGQIPFLVDHQRLQYSNFVIGEMPNSLRMSRLSMHCGYITIGSCGEYENVWFRSSAWNSMIAAGTTYLAGWVASGMAGESLVRANPYEYLEEYWNQGLMLYR